MIFRFLLLLGFLLVCIESGRAEIGYPNGVKRSWKNVLGESFEATLRIEAVEGKGDMPEEWKYSLVSESGGAAVVYPFTFPEEEILAVEEKSWIRDQIESYEWRGKATVPAGESRFDLTKNDLDRIVLDSIANELFKEVDPFVGAFAKFALWWDATGYVPFTTAGGTAEKFARISDYFGEVEKSDWDFHGAVESFSDFLEKESEATVIFSTRETIDCSPGQLAHFCAGRNATILGVSIYESGSRAGQEVVALLSAQPDGKIEFVMRGEKIKGQLKPVDASRYRDARMANGVWEVEVSNRADLSAEVLRQDSQLLIAPFLGDRLWVIQPWIMKDSSHRTSLPPPIMAPQSVLNFREKWTPFHPDWKIPRLPRERTWTRVDGKKMTGVFVSMETSNSPKVNVRSGSTVFPVDYFKLSKADRKFVLLAGGSEAPLESGMLVFELRESREKASRIEIKFRNGWVQAAVKDQVSSNEKAAVYELDCERLYFQRPGEPLRNLGGTDVIPDWAKLPAPAISELSASTPDYHDGAPCRSVPFEEREFGFANSQYKLRAKIGQIGAPEVAIFWKFFSSDAAYADQLGPFQNLFYAITRCGFIPIDLVYQRNTVPGKVLRLQLMEFEADSFSE